MDSIQEQVDNDIQDAKAVAEINEAAKNLPQNINPDEVSENNPNVEIAIAEAPAAAHIPAAKPPANYPRAPQEGIANDYQAAKAEQARVYDYQAEKAPANNNQDAKAAAKAAAKAPAYDNQAAKAPAYHAEKDQAAKAPAVDSKLAEAPAVDYQAVKAQKAGAEKPSYDYQAPDNRAAKDPAAKVYDFDNKVPPKVPAYPAYNADKNKPENIPDNKVPAREDQAAAKAPNYDDRAAKAYIENIYAGKAKKANAAEAYDHDPPSEA